MEDLLLRGNGADEVVALAEEAVGAAFEIEAGRDGLEEKLRALEVRFRMVDVVRVLQEESGDAEAGLDLHDRVERHLALAYRLQALYRLPYLSLPLVVVR